MPDYDKSAETGKLDSSKPNLTNGLGFKRRELEMIVSVPKCPCGKIPLKCPQPNNCLMENL